jgi:hypothetical protein
LAYEYAGSAYFLNTYAERSGKKHNCHMKSGKKDLWNVTDEKLMCKGKIKN